MDYYYNDQTKHADITAELVERDVQGGGSVWSITLDEDVLIDPERSRYLKRGTTFRYTGCYEDEKREVEWHVKNYGLQATCGISDGEIEARLEELCEME